MQALQFDGTSYAIPSSLDLSGISAESVEVTHFYGLDEVRFQGLAALAVGRTFGLPYARIHLARIANAIAQRFFNRRPLATRRRLDLLRDVVEMVSTGEASAVSALDMMSHRHGYRWAGHPGWQAHQKVVEVLLELLAESGELKEVGHGFRPTGQALKTLEDYEDQDRRHRSNLRVQGLLAVLAALGLVTAAAQAGLVKLPTMWDMRSVDEQKSQRPAC